MLRLTSTFFPTRERESNGNLSTQGTLSADASRPFIKLMGNIDQLLATFDDATLIVVIIAMTPMLEGNICWEVKIPNALAHEGKLGTGHTANAAIKVFQALELSVEIDGKYASQ